MTRTNRDVYTSSFLLSGHSVVSAVLVVVRLMSRHIVAQGPLCCAKECMGSSSQCVHTQHSER